MREVRLQTEAVGVGWATWDNGTDNRLFDPATGAWDEELMAALFDPGGAGGSTGGGGSNGAGGAGGRGGVSGGGGGGNGLIPCDAGGAACQPGQYCELPVFACATTSERGVCQSPPAADCIGLPGPPVCGCDGVTYLDDCARRMASVSRAMDAACSLP
jgi:hypothetical protein